MNQYIFATFFGKRIKMNAFEFISLTIYSILCYYNIIEIRISPKIKSILELYPQSKNIGPFSAKDSYSSLTGKLAIIRKLSSISAIIVTASLS
jgi:hypothetical protein